MTSSDLIHSPNFDRQRRLVLVGGFLGAGKTTLIGKLIRYLQLEGLQCGVITNDQAAGLVDTATAGTFDGARISEIAGGCFCCKLDQLTDMLDGQWSANSTDGRSSAPHVIVAEPVGSCTDLMATVLLPLSKAYGSGITVSPLSVVMDGRRALSSLGGRRTPGDFSKDIGYIFRKQIEEAEILVVNKVDLLQEEDLADLLARIKRDYVGKEVFVLSAKTGDGLEAWAKRIFRGEASPKELIEMDYERYGNGEALLGWCNAESHLQFHQPRQGNEFLISLGTLISTRLADLKMEVAHFKMALADEDGRLGVTNQVMSGITAEISRSFAGQFDNALLTVNLRAEGDPDLLKEIVEESIKGVVADSGLFRILKMAAFRPGQPVPVERVTSL